MSAACSRATSPHGRKAGTQCRNDREPEADRIIIWLVKGEPGKNRFGSPRLCALLRPPACEGLRRSGHPCGEQRGFPTSGSRPRRASTDERHRIQFVEQARAFHQRAWQTGRREPQREQRGAVLNLGRRGWPLSLLVRVAVLTVRGVSQRAPSPPAPGVRMSPWLMVPDNVCGYVDPVSDRRTNSRSRQAGLL